MKVADLIEILKLCDPNKEVMVQTENTNHIAQSVVESKLVQTGGILSEKDYCIIRDD